MPITLHHTAAPDRCSLLPVACSLFSSASFALTSESITGVSPSFTSANASFALVTLLPSAQSTSPVTRTNDSFTSVNESQTLVSELPSCVADKRGHRGTAPRNSYKTSQLQFSRARAFAQPTIRSISTGFRITMEAPLRAIRSSRSNWFSSRVTVSREVPAMLASSS